MWLSGNLLANGRKPSHLPWLEGWTQHPRYHSRPTLGTAGRGGCRMQASSASRARQHQCQPHNHDPPLPKTPRYRTPPPARGCPPLQRGKKSSHPSLRGEGRSSVGTNTKVTADSGVMPESQGESLPGHLSPSSTTYLGSKGPRKFPWFLASVSG